MNISSMYAPDIACQILLKLVDVSQSYSQGDISLLKHNVLTG